MGRRLAQRARRLTPSCCPAGADRGDRAGHDGQQRGRGPSPGGWIGRRIRGQLAPRRRHGGTSAPRRCAVRGGGPVARSGERIAEHGGPTRRQPQGPSGRLPHALLRGLRPHLPPGSVAWTRARRDQLPARRNRQHDGGWRRRFRTSSGRDGVDRRVVRDRAATAGPAAGAVAQGWRACRRATGQAGTKAAHDAADGRGLGRGRGGFVWRRICDRCAGPPGCQPADPRWASAGDSGSGRQVSAAAHTRFDRSRTEGRPRGATSKHAPARNDPAARGTGTRPGSSTGGWCGSSITQACRGAPATATRAASRRWLDTRPSSRDTDGSDRTATTRCAGRDCHTGCTLGAAGRAPRTGRWATGWRSRPWQCRSRSDRCSPAVACWRQTSSPLTHACDGQ
jgi:hypothetical protein